jgi:hypothetical protein
MEYQRQTAVARARLDALHAFIERVAPDRETTAERLDHAAAVVLAGFDRAGVDAILLKGQGLATLLYGAGNRRSFSDVDLLVDPAEFDAAEDALARLGYVNGDPDIDDVGRVVHAHMWVRTEAGSNVHPPIDLHRWLPGARADPAVAWDALVARRVRVDLGGRPVAVLDRVGQAMHLATHSAQHGPAVSKHIHELELALEVWPIEVWESAAQLAGQIAATEAFAAGLRLSRRGTAVAARLELPPTETLDWVIRHRGDRPRGTFHLQALAGARDLRDGFSVLRRSLLPRRAWIIHAYPWAERSWLRMIAAYGVHLAQAPAMAARACTFGRRARRAGRTH